MSLATRMSSRVGYDSTWLSMDNVHFTDAGHLLTIRTHLMDEPIEFDTFDVFTNMPAFPKMPDPWPNKIEVVTYLFQGTVVTEINDSVVARLAMFWRTYAEPVWP